MENVFTQSIWGDEGFSAILSMKSGIPEIVKIISRDTSPPLWNIFEYLAFQAFGVSEITIRSLSLAFYLLTAFFVFKIGSLFFSKKTATLSTVLILLNPFFFTYAFEGRMYSIMAVGVAGSMYFFLKSFFGEGGPWTRVGFIVMTLWALYSHHFAIFALFVQGLWWLYELAFGRRKTAGRIFKSYLIIALLYLPWLYPLYTQARMVSGGFWLGTPTLTDLKKLIYEYLAEGTRTWDYSLPYINTKLYSLSLYIVFLTLALRKWWKGIEKTIFLLLWFLGPIIIAWLVSQKFSSIFYNRYLLYVIPAAMLILASSRSKLSLVPISLLIILFGVTDFQYFTNPAKLPFRAFSEVVKSDIRDGDYLVNWYSNGTHHIWETKFYGLKAPIYVGKDGGNLPFFVGTALMEKTDIIKEIPSNIKRVGAITSGDERNVSLEGYTVSYIKSVGSIKLVWLEPKK